MGAGVRGAHGGRIAGACRGCQGKGMCVHVTALDLWGFSRGIGAPSALGIVACGMEDPAAGVCWEGRKGPLIPASRPHPRAD